MAASFTLGQNFALLLTIGGDNVELVCKTASTINFTNTSTEVRNRCTGDYSVRLAGGQKAGSIDFTGDYDLTPTAPNISAFDIAQLSGLVYPAIWGGTEVGDEIVTVDVQINSISITADNDAQVSFSATLDFAGEPVFSLVTS
tara:strand:+ start:34709 stop:35137 length:429 start_codon:yes stop_codon:yes gene_type:complete